MEICLFGIDMGVVEDTLGIGKCWAEAVAAGIGGGVGVSLGGRMATAAIATTGSGLVGVSRLIKGISVCYVNLGARRNCKPSFLLSSIGGFHWIKQLWYRTGLVSLGYE